MRTLRIIVILLAGAMGQAQQASSPPPPPFHEIAEDVVQHLEKLHAAERDYICVKREIETSLDGSGNDKKSTVRIFEVFFIGDTKFERLVSVDGQPVSEKEERKQQEQMEKLARKNEQGLKNTDQGSAERDGKKDNKDPKAFAAILYALNFSEGTREQWQGRSVVRYDFRPRQGYKPRRKAEEVLNKIAGSVWIDESELRIARLDATLTDGVRFGWFLGSLSEGARIRVEFQPVEPGLWLPSKIESEGKFRVVVKSIRKRYSAEYSEFRKFRVDTAVKPIEQAQ